DTATTEIYTLSLHDALPISSPLLRPVLSKSGARDGVCALARASRAAVQCNCCLSVQGSACQGRIGLLVVSGCGWCGGLVRRARGRPGLSRCSTLGGSAT